MNNPSPGPETAADQWSAFQRVWTETLAKMMQAGFTTPDAAPPEFVRQLRTGIFQALAQSWDQFLRSPQFLEGMKQWMDSAVAFREMSNEFLTRARQASHLPGQDDIENVLNAVGKAEARLLERIETLAVQVKAMEQRLADRDAGAAAPAAKSKDARRRVRRAPS